MKSIKRPFAVSAAALLFSDIVLMLAGNDALFFLILIFCAVCTVSAILRSYLSQIFLLICSMFVISAIIFNSFSGIAETVQKVSGHNKNLSGTVLTYTQNTNTDLLNFILKDAEIEGTKIHGKLSVYYDGSKELTPGDKITFVADSVFPDSSDGIYKYHSLSDKTYLTAFSYDEITVTEKHSDNSLYTKILTLRKGVTDKFFSYLSKDNAAMVTALITGEKSYLSDEILTCFKISGISHIFAVSGMHLSVWTGIFFLIFKQRAKVSLLPNLAALLFILFYIVFTGFSPSVMRAGIMLSCVFIAKIIRRHSDPLNTWGIAGTFLLLTNPFLAGNVSFLLSYIATFALVFFSQLLVPSQRKTEKTYIKNKFVKIKNSFAASLCVILMTLPISAVFFGCISLLSPISSVILTPIAEILMITAGISLILPTENFISELFFSITEFFSEIILSFTVFMKKFDFAVYPINLKIILPWFIITGVIIAIILVLKKSEKTAIKALLSSIVVLIFLTTISENLHYGETSVYIPSGENATCITVYKGGKSVIYGTGGTYETTAQTRSFLNSKGSFTASKLYIPREKESENNNTDYFTKTLLSKNTVTLYSENKSIFSEKIWNNAEIYSVSSDSFCACVLYLDNVKIVICPLPGSDFSSQDECFSYGDILICRSKIPKSIDCSKFSSVIIMTDKELPSTYSDALSSEDGSIEITLKGDSYVINR